MRDALWVCYFLIRRRRGRLSLGSDKSSLQDSEGDPFSVDFDRRFRISQLLDDLPVLEMENIDPAPFLGFSFVAFLE